MADFMSPFMSPCQREIVAFLTANGETSLTSLTGALGRSKSNVCHDLRILLRKQLVSRRYEGHDAIYWAVSS